MLAYGKSKHFQQIIEEAEKMAQSDWPVLLLGETGVGKEVLANHIHKKSKRAHRPFVSVNCAALSPNLFESELFGHEKGAFSGALRSHAGLIGAAERGTLFLDEIGELELPLQAKLLRLLESHEYRPVGASKNKYCDVRFLTATNVALEKATQEKSFRSDLYQRLSVLSVKIPPLRERKEDLPLLVAFLCHHIGCTFDPEIVPILKELPWPGNVRELKNTLIRGSVIGDGRVTLDVIQKFQREHPFGAFRAVPVARTLAEIERQAILDRLGECRGNRTLTARELGIAKSTLHEKLRRWNDHPPLTVEPDGRERRSGGLGL